MNDTRRSEYIARRLTDRAVMTAGIERYVRPAPRPLRVRVTAAKRWLLGFGPIRRLNDLRHQKSRA